MCGACVFFLGGGQSNGGAKGVPARGPQTGVAVCCSVLQYVAACHSVLPRVAARGAQTSVTVCCSVLQCVTVCYSVLQCVAVCCNVVQCIAARGAQTGVAVCCCVLLRVAAFCNVLQYEARKRICNSIRISHPQNHDYY